MGETRALSSSVLNVHLAGLIYIIVLIIITIYDPCVLAYYLIKAQFIVCCHLREKKIYITV